MTPPAFRSFSPAGRHFFLFSPVQTEMLAECLDLLSEDCRSCRSLAISGKNGITSILCDNIHYIESDRRTVLIHEKDNCHVFYKKLDDLERQIGPPFLRCHKSYLVNMDHVGLFLPDCIRLRSGVDIPVSQTRYSGARNSYVNYMAGKIL